MSIIKKIVNLIQQIFFRYVRAKYSVYVFLYCELSEEDSGNIAGVNVNTFKLFTIEPLTHEQVAEAIVKAFGNAITNFVPLTLHKDFAFVALKGTQNQIYMNPFFNLILFRVGSMDKKFSEVHTIVNFNRENGEEVWNDLSELVKPVLSKFLPGSV